MKNKARGNEAEMANIARGKAECYISIEAEFYMTKIMHIECELIRIDHVHMEFALTQFELKPN